jgi:hypothetical protein
MKIRAMALAGTTLGLSLAVGPFIRPATAGSVVAYNFSGKIQTVSQQATTATGVVVGDTITGSFSYDYTQTGSGGVYNFTGSSKIHTLAFKIFDASNNQIFTDQYTGNSTLQTAGYYAAKVTYTSSTNTANLDLVGDTIYKQGLGQTFFNTGIPAFDLTITYPNSTGFSSTSLPLPNTTVITKFVSNSGLLTWDPDGQNFTAIVHFSVPEPPGLLLGVLSILTCAGGSAVIRRGRDAAPRPHRTGSPG